MPTMRTRFEREILDLSRAALQLERLAARSDSTPGPVQYQQILARLSELYVSWQEHRVHQRMRFSRLLSNNAEVSLAEVPLIVQDWDAPSFNVELQLKALSTSTCPRSIPAGLLSIRVAVPEILQLMYQQIERERTTYLTLSEKGSTPFPCVFIRPI